MAGVLTFTAGRAVTDLHRFAFQLSLQSLAGAMNTILLFRHYIKDRITMSKSPSFKGITQVNLRRPHQIF